MIFPTICNSPRLPGEVGCDDDGVMIKPDEATNVVKLESIVERFLHW